VFQRWLSLKALSKGKPKPGPLGQDSLLKQKAKIMQKMISTCF
jgi:hypothetical protein